MEVGISEANVDAAAAERRAPPRWLKLTGDGMVESEGFFPSAWLREGASDPQAMLVRLDAEDMTSLDYPALAELRTMALRGECFAFLVRRWNGSISGATFGPTIDSFACSLSLARRHVESIGGGAMHIPYVDSVLPNLVDIAAYDLSVFVMERMRPVPPVRCLQIPYASSRRPVLPGVDVRAEWIIPHRGNMDFLEACLSTMRLVAAPADRVSIGFDEACSSRHQELVSRYPDYRFFEVLPEGNGPSVAMDKLWRASSAHFIFFQDSDDISCVDRRDRLLVELLSRDLDLVGCHEVRVDDARRVVQAVRFPHAFDPDSLVPINGHAVSIPLSVMRRSALAKAGGFSSVRRFAHDTEYLYRLAQSGARIGSVDEYLFIRRKHKDSMTAHPETGHRTRQRMELLRAWGRDFDLWRKGQMPADEVSFALKHRDDYRHISLHPMV